MIVDAVGGEVRARSLDLFASSGRLLLVGNPSGDRVPGLDGTRIWQGNVSVVGFNAGAHLLRHPDAVPPAVNAALVAATGGLADTAQEAAVGVEQRGDRAPVPLEYR